MSNAKRAGLVLGVDVGGTKVATGVVTIDGEIFHRTREPMVSGNGASAGLNAVLSAINVVRNLASNSDRALEGIGICAPGPLDPTTGVVLNPPNLPCWRNFPLAAEVARVYGVNVHVDNDANAAGLAESKWGAGRGYRRVFYVTIGTGIGTAIVLDGHIYHGRTGAAGEGGHVSIDYNGPYCSCGKRGCIEALASGPAIARRARERLEEGEKSALTTLVDGKLDLITSELIGKTAAAGDSVANSVVSETLNYLSCWLGNIIDLLDPDVIIVGGGVGVMLRPLLPGIRERLPSYCVNQRCQESPLVPARYGQDAGIAGGAALCFDTTTENALFL